MKNKEINYEMELQEIDELMNEINEDKFYYRMLKNYGDLINVSELCEILGIKRNLAYKLLQNKTIKSLKMGSIYKIPKLYLIKFLKSGIRGE